MKVKEESFWKFIVACLRTGNKELAKKLIKQNKKQIMEANAPEKLYLIQHNGLICYCRNNDEDIEYIRKDAFIERACKFLKSYRQDTCDGMGYIAGIVNDKTIEDFKKYMEGE